MAISATKLRSNLYRVIDDVIRKGVPVEVELRGRKVFIVPAEPPDKLAKLVKRPGVILGDPGRLPAGSSGSRWPGYSRRSIA